uniref:Uncharacterized protein n=1 Tax=Anolis carolinensis TaxID=28377 RepID=A0A803SUW2_ANOCA
PGPARQQDTLYEAVKEDKHFSGTIKLKSAQWPKYSVLLCDQQHCGEAKAVDIPHMDIQGLKKLNKNKKLVKKLAKKYNISLASVSDQADSSNLRPGTEQGWQVFYSPHSENMVSTMDEVKSIIKFQMKKVLCLADELVYNSHLAINFLVSMLKKNRQNVWALYIKSTMGKPQCFY